MKVPRLEHQSGYPSLREAVGELGGTPNPTTGALVPIEPRRPGRANPIRKDAFLRAEAPHEPLIRVPISFQCPSCACWLQIEDPQTFTGGPAPCPTCERKIYAPRISHDSPW